MINLGDVQFSLGADVAALRNSIGVMNQFARTVTNAQNIAGRAGQAAAASLRRQEKAASDAFNQIQRLNNGMARMEGSARFVRANEQAFASLSRQLSSGTLTALQYQRAMEAFRNSVQSTARQFQTFKSQAEGTSNVVGGLSNRFRDLASATVLINGPLGGIATRIQTINAVMGRSGTAVAAFVAGFGAGGAALYAFSKTLLAAGRDAKQFESIFMAVTGNVTASWKGVAEATRIAQSTGTLIQDIVPAMARFNAAAKDTGISGKEISDAFTAVAASSAKLQLGSEQTQGIFRALEQMMSKGTVQAEELRGQLGDRLPGAFQIAARAMGVTTIQLGEMMKKGQVLTRDFLPKFTQELKRTFNIDGSPIMNFISAQNRMINNWYSLRVALDAQLGVSDRVMKLYQEIASVLEYVTENLGQIKIYAVAALGALAGLVAPAVISGFLALGAAIIRIGSSAQTLNTILMALPFGRIISLALRFGLVIGTVTAALSSQADEIVVLQGRYGTLQDYMQVMWSDIKTYAADYFSSVQSYFANFESSWQGLNDWLRSVSTKSWKDLAIDAKTIVTDLVDGIIKAFNELGIRIGGIISNVTVELRGFAELVNSGREWLSPWLDDLTGGQAPKGFESLERFIEGTKDVEWKSMEQLNMQVAAMRNNVDSFKSGDKMLNWMDDVSKRADKAAKDRVLTNFLQSEKAGYGVNNGTPNFGQPGKSVPNVDPVDEKAVKKAQRLADAIGRMNTEIDRTYEEIQALQGSDMGLKMLNDQFKREDEVRRYAKAMEKAGASTELVRQKSMQLMAALEIRDRLVNARRALEEWQSTLTSSFDAVGQTLFDAMLDGGESMKKLPDIARQVARDIFNTFLQLQLMNPLKNLLFGTNLPTSGGGGGILGSIMGLLGGGGGFSSAAYAGAAAGIGLYRRGGIFQNGYQRAAKGMVLNGPTPFMSGNGPILGGEAGAEALIPLQKDSTGKLGLKGGKSVRMQNNFTFAPNYNVVGNSEDINALRVQIARDQASFEARTLKTIRDAQKGRKL